MSDKIKTLQEVVNTPAGEYIGGGFQAVVTEPRSLQTKKGNTMHKAVLTEGNLRVHATSFTTSFEPLNGKLVKWLGMGLRRGDDYNGQAQVSIGDKARWIPVGEAPAAPAPQAQQSAPASGQSAPAHSAQKGETVGMTINNAVAIALYSGDYSEEAVWRIASGLLRVSERLQKGDLAPAQQDNDGNNDEPPF